MRACVYAQIDRLGRSRAYHYPPPPPAQHNTAVSNIGVDVEVCEPRKRTASIAPRVLTEKERCVHQPIALAGCVM